ncbi:MAG: hypothetical protein LBJ93_03705 [Clostridiales bacterium]|jgi:hypothetical protein|nr:hypothetical protein [Clostridiales bacterium]
MFYDHIKISHQEIDRREIGFMLKEAVRSESEQQINSAKKFQLEIAKIHIALFYSYKIVKLLKGKSLDFFTLTIDFFFIIDRYLDKNSNEREQRTAELTNSFREDLISSIMKSKKKDMNPIEQALKNLLKDRIYMQKILDSPENLSDIREQLIQEIKKSNSYILASFSIFISIIFALSSLTSPVFGILFLGLKNGICMSAIPLVIISIALYFIIRHVKKRFRDQKIRKDFMENSNIKSLCHTLDFLANNTRLTYPEGSKSAIDRYAYSLETKKSKKKTELYQKRINFEQIDPTY